MDARRAVFELKRHTVLTRSDGILRRLVANESIPGAEILGLQRRRAIAHARYAMENTTFYRDYYSGAGFKPADLDDPQAFDELPIVEKQHVRDNFEGFKTPEATSRKSAVSMTGGSTGQPLHILRDRRVSAQPLEWRLFRWWGVHPSDNIAIVFRQVKTGRDRMIHAAKWWPSKRIQLDAYRINEASVLEFAARWQAAKPTLLTGYAGGVLELARVVERIGLPFSPLVAIATTASPLSAEHRLEVEQILKAPVYDHYRSAEIPWMGGECAERNGHHIFAEVRVVEVVDASGRAVSGEVGQVVATDLTNRVFPFVRYRLGDRTRTLDGPCPCGVELPRIDHVIGKVGDGLRLPDGTWIATEAIYQLFSKNPSAVRQFMVHQLADHSIQISCVAGPAPDAASFIDQVVGTLRDRVNHSVPVSYELVDEIRAEGGKIRYVKSEVR
jgi:phenylacetate-CoA ligase